MDARNTLLLAWARSGAPLFRLVEERDPTEDQALQGCTVSTGVVLVVPSSPGARFSATITRDFLVSRHVSVLRGCSCSGP